MKASVTALWVCGFGDKVLLRPFDPRLALDGLELAVQAGLAPAS